MELNKVNFEQARALKELGFPQEYGWDNRYFCTEGYTFTPREANKERVAFAPTFELVAKWLRDEKRISISVSWMPNVKMYNCICSDMDYTPKEHSHKDAFKMYKEHFEVINKDDNSYKFKTFEAALSAGINKAIELLTNKNH